MGLFNLFRKREEKQKERVKKQIAVVEGNYADDFCELNYVQTLVEVPENATILNDGLFKYRLYGRTEDFYSIPKPVEIIENLEAKISSRAAFALEGPRTFCLEDGRMYIRESMITDENYLQVIPLILEVVRNTFDAKRKFDELNKEKQVA